MADSSWEFTDPSEPAREAKPEPESRTKHSYEIVLKEERDGFQALEAIIDQLEVA